MTYVRAPCNWVTGAVTRTVRVYVLARVVRAIFFAGADTAGACNELSYYWVVNLLSTLVRVAALVEESLL